ncbi:MAG: hypothetical protein ACTSUE_08690 [Promethearchaeota archaeon]
MPPSVGPWLRTRQERRDSMSRLNNQHPPFFLPEILREGKWFMNYQRSPGSGDG